MTADDIRMPPQNLEAESSVLGGILLDNEAINVVLETLRPEDFYRESHRRIMRAMIEITDRGEPVDLITLSDFIETRNELESVGGSAYLASLADFVPTAANIAFYVRIVHEKAQRRKLIDRFKDATSRLYDDNLDDSGVHGLTLELVDEISRITNLNADFLAELPAGSTLEQDLIYRCFSDIDAIPIEWLWQDMIAARKFTVMAGHPGLGKSQLSILIAATVSNGGRWPLCETAAPLGSVIILSSEDAAEDTIRPRLEAAGADLDKVFIIDAVKDSSNKFSGTRLFNLDADLRRLPAMLKKIGDVALIIVDPFTAYTGDIDSHNTAEMRELLARMDEVSRRTNVAIIGVTHLTKKEGTEVLMRVTGSHALTAAARSVFLVTKDPDVSDRRLFLALKGNISPEAIGGLAFRVEGHTITSGIKTSKIRWEAEPVTVSADEVMAANAAVAEKSQTAEAMDWLQVKLEGGPGAAAILTKEGRAIGFTDKCLRSAREKLGVLSNKSAFDGGWMWSLPPKKPQVAHQDAQVAQDAGRGQVGILGDQGHLREKAEGWEKVL